jgi:hypothetical protein
MARTKQAANKSTGGHATHEVLSQACLNAKISPPTADTVTTKETSRPATRSNTIVNHAKIPV